MNHFLLACVYLFLGFNAFSQKHLEPVNGGMGKPGPVNYSFMIVWESMESAIDYEYVMSDNPLCFSGCPGDTRQRTSGGDTTALEFNMQSNKWYYWIVRTVYGPGDTSDWTGITSFLAKAPEIDNTMIVVTPNPVNDQLKIQIDWAVNPKARNITLTIYNLAGQIVNNTVQIAKTGNVRFQDFQLDISHLESGIFIGDLIVEDNPNNPNNRVIVKIIKI